MCPAAEVVIPGENGLLVPPNDVEALTAALLSLLSNTEKRLEMRRRARQYVVRNADSRDCVQRLADLYASVAQRCGPTGGTVERR